MNNIQFKQVAVGTIGRRKPSPMVLGGGAGHILDSLGGKFTVELWRGDKFISRHFAKNGITNEGKNDALDVLFDGGTQITSWYLGLIDDTGFTALDAGDTYDNINQAGNGWDEFTDYTDPQNGDSTTTRPEWAPDEPASQSVSNSTVRSYDITASGTVKGLFVVGGGGAPQTKDDHAAGSILWATALFTGGDVPVANTETLKVTYTVSA